MRTYDRLALQRENGQRRLYLPPVLRGSFPDSVGIDICRRLDAATVFDVTNAAQYLFQVDERERFDRAADFPRPMPPFASTWIEAPMPAWTYSAEKGRTYTDWAQHGIRRFGVLCNALPADDVTLDEISIPTPDGRNILATMREQHPHTVVRAWLFIEGDIRPYRDIVVGPVCGWGWVLNAAGSMLGIVDEHGPAPAIFSDMLGVDVIDRNTAAVDWLKGSAIEHSVFLDCTLFALAMMHCKNVTPRVVAPPPKLDAKHRRRYGRGLVTHRVLEIVPMRALHRAAHARAAGESRAVPSLHIVRGRFRTYTEDRPLFGKWAGTWFWDDYVRGSEESGRVEKTYALAAPKVAE